MTHSDFTPGKDTATRKDKADRWAQTPNTLLSIFLVIPFIAAGVFTDQDSGETGAALIADLISLPIWLVVATLIVCTLIGLGGSFAVLRGWLSRKDELERRIDLETGFWAGNAALFSLIALAVFEAISPGHLTPWIITVCASGVWLLVTFIVRHRLRNKVA